MKSRQRRCKNCKAPIIHNDYDWEHAESGKYLCEDSETEVATP